MSLVLYNPLEAGVLLLASWFFKPRNIHRPHFNIKEFIHKCYIIGLLNYIIQIPEQFLENSLFYFFYLFAVVFFGMSLTLKIFGYKNIWACCMSIMLLYNFSLTLIVDIGKMPTIISEIVSNNAQQLLNNLIIRIVQILIIFILLGGRLK
jgi:hypothetical protein